MSTYTEVTYISEFNILPTGQIAVRKTTDVTKTDGDVSTVISSTYWRVVLTPNDPTASTVLNEQYYLDIANYAWSQPSPQPYPPVSPLEQGA